MMIKKDMVGRKEYVLSQTNSTSANPADDRFLNVFFIVLFSRLQMCNQMKSKQ